MRSDTKESKRARGGAEQQETGFTRTCRVTTNEVRRNETCTSESHVTCPPRGTRGGHVTRRTEQSAATMSKNETWSLRSTRGQIDRKLDKLSRNRGRIHTIMKFYAKLLHFKTFLLSTWQVNLAQINIYSSIFRKNEYRFGHH